LVAVKVSLVLLDIDERLSSKTIPLLWLGEVFGFFDMRLLFVYQCRRNCGGSGWRDRGRYWWQQRRRWWRWPSRWSSTGWLVWWVSALRISWRIRWAERGSTGTKRIVVGV
jgi:hypothetical protein